MKHLILSAVTAVTLLTTATTMLWSHSLSAAHQAAAMVIGHCKNFHSLTGESFRTTALLTWGFRFTEAQVGLPLGPSADLFT